MKRAALFLLPALVAALAGCQSSKPCLPREVQTPDGDLAKARALAHYAVGFLLSFESPAAAREAFLRAHLADPASSAPAEAAAQHLLREDPDEVLKILEHHARASHAPAYAWHLLGQCAEFFDDNPRAAAAYANALKIKNLPDALRRQIFTGLVRAEFYSGNDSRAIKLLKTEAAKNPETRAAMRAIATAWQQKFLATGEKKRAEKLGDFIATLAPSP